jgi:ribosomal protein L11 methyltransferase
MPYFELTISAPSEARDRLIASLNEKGSLGFIEHEDGFTAYFPETADQAGLIRTVEIMRSLLLHAGVVMNYSTAILPDQDWNESWKKGFTRLDVGDRFSVLPPWEPLQPGRINLIIDPGMAFGTGHHETTRSCLVLMDRYDGRTGKEHFLDLGCGTGVLAIAASKLGFREVVAADTDPLATEATRMNVELNGVSNVAIRDGSIEQTEGNFDCIAANIISGVLVGLAPALAARIKPSGLCILSGILAEQADEVIAAMSDAGLKLREPYPDGKWISLVMAP